VADPRGQGVGLGVHLGEELVARLGVLVEVGLEAGDRVPVLPDLLFGLVAVLRRIVGGRVGAAAVGEGLDEHRAVAGPHRVEAGAGDGVHRDDVVAVDADAGDAEALAALAQGCRGLDVGRLGDRPLVVLAEEQHRGVEGAGEGQRLGDIALRGGAVAEAGDGHGVAVDVAGADVAVQGSRPWRSRWRAGSASR
jgi:hypothetical protein